MKVLLPTALAAVAVSAIPSPWFADAHRVLSLLSLDSVFTRIGLKNAEGVYDAFQAADQTAWNANGHNLVQHGSSLYQRMDLSDKYQLRIALDQHGQQRSPKICDTVKQRSGYFDISDERHLFFWFFEARNNPETAPLVLWLNGGPGCSSSAGLLMELGPCLVLEEGEPKRNPFSWNNNFNMIFLDQPADVGFSYKTGGKGVNNLAEIGPDVWAFLQLFLRSFPQYADLPFHLTGESYAGHYLPNIASIIHERNQEIQQGIRQSDANIINLASIAIGNGLTEPKTQMASIPEYGCHGPYPIFGPKSSTCRTLSRNAKICERLISTCYSLTTPVTCAPATYFCWMTMYPPMLKTGLNHYDVRRPCEDKESGLCYSDLKYVDAFLNRPDVQEELGVEPGISYTDCNFNMTQSFMAHGDHMHNSAALLPPLLEAGIRLLTYVGNADYVCPYIGIERWMDKLEGHPYVDEFRASVPGVEWSVNGTVAGRVRTGSSGNFTFIEVYEAGHMVPYDQPEASLDMIERWVFDKLFHD